jgi:hypothetical protein
MIAMTNVEMRKESRGLEIEVFNPDRARIRSTWPVTLPRGNTSIGTKMLSEALEEGIEATCDTRRAGFFEADNGNAWFYFHIAHNLGRIYLVAALVR